MIIEHIVKTPSETAIIELDFTEDLVGGEVIDNIPSTNTIIYCINEDLNTVDDTVIDGDHSLTGNIISINTVDGVNKGTYLIGAIVLTNDAHNYERKKRLIVRS